MNANRSLASRLRTHHAASIAVALLLCAGGAMAGKTSGGSGVAITAASDPAEVSVSRVDGPPFYVSYIVTVTNNSANNTQTYDYKATTVTYDSNGTKANYRPTFVGSRGISSAGEPCTVGVPPGNDPAMTVVTCAKVSVDKNSSKTFRLTYRTPVDGAKLKITVESTSSAIKGSASAETKLITVPYYQTIVGFSTYVPPEGGTFFTGANGNLAGSPGAPATTNDPWTTTIVIPPIGFSTTATVAEQQNGELSGCSGTYYISGGCFDSNLTIPSAPGAIQTMSIYLRIDRTRINLLGNNINDAVIKYAKDGVNFTTVPNCSATVVPAAGQPCIQARRAYGSDVPTEWVYDWEFLIYALDNGRYIN